MYDTIVSRKYILINFEEVLVGVIVSKDQDQTKLQKRITADLHNRAKATNNGGTSKDPDFAEDSAYVKGLKKTGRFSWVWIVLIVLAIIALIIIFLF